MKILVLILSVVVMIGIAVVCGPWIVGITLSGSSSDIEPDDLPGVYRPGADVEESVWSVRVGRCIEEAETLDRLMKKFPLPDRLRSDSWNDDDDKDINAWPSLRDVVSAYASRTGVDDFDVRPFLDDFHLDRQTVGDLSEQRCLVNGRHSYERISTCARVFVDLAAIRRVQGRLEEAYRIATAVWILGQVIGRGQAKENDVDLATVGIRCGTWAEKEICSIAREPGISRDLADRIARERKTRGGCSLDCWEVIESQRCYSLRKYAAINKKHPFACLLASILYDYDTRLINRYFDLLLENRDLPYWRASPRCGVTHENFVHDHEIVPLFTGLTLDVSRFVGICGMLRKYTLKGA